MTSITIPDSVRTLGNNLFAFENQLATITIGANVDFHWNGTFGWQDFRVLMEFDTFYIQNGRMAGIYRASFDNHGFLSNWLFSPQ